MSRLQRYILWEVLKAFVPAFAVLTLMMTLAFCVQLLNEGLDVVRLRGLPQHIITYAVPMVLPTAFLTAVIMAFGRLTADTEITAIRAGGVHLAHVIVPVLGFAALLSVVAAYFLFQLVPTARMKRKELKDEAIRQIILDNVVLAAQRQFSFPKSSLYIQYDDFRDGKMHGILILGADQGIPKTIITARTGQLKPSPEGNELIQIELEDCLFMRSGSESVLGREPTTAPSMIMQAKVGRDKTQISGKVKHLSLGNLIEHVRELRRTVAQHPRVFDDPDAEGKKVRDLLQGLELRISPTRERLARCIKELGDLDEDKRSDRSVIEIKRAQLTRFRDDGDLLQAQFVRYSDDIKRLQGKTGAYRELEKLQQQLNDVRDKLNSLTVKEAAAEKEIEEAQARIAGHDRKVMEKEELVGELDLELSEFSKEKGPLRIRLDRAKVQSRLRSAWLRVHKRLVQAMAVLTFALVGIPLSIITRRRSVAFLIGFVAVFLVFYLSLLFSQVVSEAGILPMGPAMWIGNFVTLALGLALTFAVLRK
ncbi:MAG: LptF/LptG family permease [Candidatus Brocadiia bacterium]|nr:LptF/LptG family permease [Candidatus Brocadiia bacterium]